MFEDYLESSYVKERIKKADELREMGINPYNNSLEKEIKNSQFLEKYSYVSEIESKRDEGAVVRVAGRVKFLRLMGKAAFLKIEDESGALQIYYSKNDLGDELFATIKKSVEVGDIISVCGYPFLTKTGELSLHTKEIAVVTKSIIPLPEKYHGLVDIEARYRQRYLDLIMNAEVKKSFILRSQVVSLIRSFFEKREFLEVETPMMHPIPGGANARAFVTHHNALGVDRYLRIAPELYLKRLLVGGFEAVFEINRNFRNEGMDHSHNPEFTMIEFYWAYKRYDDLMRLTQELFSYIFENLNLPTKLTYGEYEIDFKMPFREIKYVDAIVEIGGVSKDVVSDKDKLKELLRKNNLESKEDSLGYLQAEAFDLFVEDKLIDPTFVTHFPIEISPLARRSDENPLVAERFELFIGKKEIANGFSELNDPLDQYERFKAQVAKKESGDDEAQHMDEDFVVALGYGMPPAAGEGIGIDRLVMLLTNSHTIKDVILFPAMKPKS